MNNIETIYADIRKLFSIQLHEFFRQYQQKTINPEKLLENFEENNKYLLEVIERADNIDDEKFTLKDQLDVSAAEFVLAFLMKLDDSYPDNGNILDTDEGEF